MNARLSRKDFLKALAALYVAALQINLLTGCAAKQEAFDIKGQIPPQRKPVDGQDKRRFADLAVAEGGSPGENTEKAIAALGGMARFVRKGDRVVVKPNILSAREPQYAITTNPDVIGAIVALCVEAGAGDVLVIDSPTTGVDEAYRVTGIGAAAERSGGRVRVLNDNDFTDVAIPDGKALKRWPISRDVLGADVLINVPIAKHHSLTGVTLGMKNLMGIIGGNRGQLHWDIDQKLADLSTLIKPQLTVLDANRVLVRNGPSGGSLDDVEERKIVVAGVDRVLVDTYGASLFGLGPDDIGHIAIAIKMGLGSHDLEKSDIIRVAL